MKHLKKLFLLRLGYELNLQNPKTFNEKLNWIKLNGITPLMLICADKYRVLEYLKKEGFEKYVVPLYDVADSFDDLDWEILPKCFVILAILPQAICDTLTNFIPESGSIPAKPSTRALIFGPIFGILGPLFWIFGPIFVILGQMKLMKGN